MLTARRVGNNTLTWVVRDPSASRTGDRLRKPVRDLLRGGWRPTHRKPPRERKPLKYQVSVSLEPPGMPIAVAYVPSAFEQGSKRVRDKR